MYEGNISWHRHKNTSITVIDTINYLLSDGSNKVEVEVEVEVKAVHPKHTTLSVFHLCVQPV